MNYVWVFLGGGLGSLLRFLVSGLVDQRIGETFPWGTLAVNVSGCFLIGLLAAGLGPESRWLAPPAARTFLMIGLCGGYTTFSAFSLQTLAQVQGGEWQRAAVHVALSLVGCLLAVWAGHWVAASLSAMKGA